MKYVKQNFFFLKYIYMNEKKRKSSTGVLKYENYYNQKVI